MVYVEAPATISGINLPSVFLAGSITGAEDWQKIIVEKIKDANLVIYNPRRKNFPMNDPAAAEGQIIWEHTKLKEASMISFWFAKETMAPITLYELGAHSMTQKPIIIGIDPKYRRKQDVEIQTKLVRPDIKIVYSLNDLSNGILELYNNIAPYV